MENSNKIIPPHLNAEVYRTDTTGTSTVSYLDYIKINSDGCILVGCSELTGRYWNGGACVFKNIPESHKFHSDTKKSIYLNSGTPDGCFVTSNKVLICEDNGTVSIWQSNEDVWKHWNEVISITDHDDAVLGVDCLDPAQVYVTVGADGNIKIWDINEMLAIRPYYQAHSLAINGVSVKPNSKTVFATCSLDNCVSLWDQTMAKAVSVAVHNNCSVRCIKWLDDNRIIYGDEAGALSIVDIRNPEEVHKIADFPAAVHQLAVNSKSSNVAVCCDNKIVSVCGIDKENLCNVVYSDRHMHSNYVRGVAWDVENVNKLHTLGWDGEIKSHTISD